MTITTTITQFSGGVTALENKSSRGVANYLLWLCGRYGVEAKNLINIGGGGTVIPVPPPYAPVNPLEFVVSNTSPISTGGNSINIPAYIGYNLVFFRNNIPQSQINSGGTYFTWNKITGDFSCVGDASVDELFSLNPFL